MRSWFWFEENQVDGFIRDGEFMRDLVGKDGVVKFQFDGVRVLFTSSFARERRTEALLAVDDRCRRGFFFFFFFSSKRLSFQLLPDCFHRTSVDHQNPFLLFFFFSAHIQTLARKHNHARSNVPQRRSFSFLLLHRFQRVRISYLQLNRISNRIFDLER